MSALSFRHNSKYLSEKTITTIPFFRRLWAVERPVFSDGRPLRGRKRQLPGAKELYCYGGRRHGQGGGDHGALGLLCLAASHAGRLSAGVGAVESSQDGVFIHSLFSLI